MVLLLLLIIMIIIMAMYCILVFVCVYIYMCCILVLVCMYILVPLLKHRVSKSNDLGAISLQGQNLTAGVSIHYIDTGVVCGQMWPTSRKFEITVLYQTRTVLTCSTDQLLDWIIGHFICQDKYQWQSRS